MERHDRAFFCKELENTARTAATTTTVARFIERKRGFHMTTFQTCEAACAGHPDKLCDLIADSILGACLRVDKAARVACEVMATKGHIIVAGEITCAERVDVGSCISPGTSS